jgi:hypothetical protein
MKNLKENFQSWSIIAPNLNAIDKGGNDGRS